MRAANILIVEDHASSRALVEWVLTTFGHCVMTTANGREALERAGGQTPDLVLIDLRMPGMNGCELATHLRSMRALRDVPMIAVTALHDKDQRNEAMRCGFDGYIEKPIDPERFVPEVEAFLPPSCRLSSVQFPR